MSDEPETPVEDPSADNTSGTETETPETEQAPEPSLTIQWKGRAVEMPQSKVITLAQQTYDLNQRREAFNAERQQWEEANKSLAERTRAWEAFLNDPSNAREAQEIVSILQGKKVQEAKHQGQPSMDDEDFDLDSYLEGGPDEEEAPKRGRRVTHALVGTVQAMAEELKAMKAERAAEKEAQAAAELKAREAEAGSKARAEIDRLVAKSPVLSKFPKDRMRTEVILEMAQHDGRVDPEIAVKLVEADYKKSREEMLAEYLKEKERSSETAQADSPRGTPPAREPYKPAPGDLNSGKTRDLFLADILAARTARKGGSG